MAKAILIDAVNKQVTPYEYTGLKSLQDAVGGLICTALRFPNDDYLFVNDDGLLDESITAYFAINGGTQPYAGNGVIVGREDEDGKVYDVTLTVEDVTKNVRYLNRSQVDVESLLHIQFVPFTRAGHIYRDDE